MTLEAWVYPTALTDWRTVIQKEEPEGTVYFLQVNSDVNRPSIGMSINGEESLYGRTRLAAAPGRIWRRPMMAPGSGSMSMGSKQPSGSRRA